MSFAVLPVRFRLVSVALVTLAFLLSATPAHAQTASISGTVTAAGGGGLSNVGVNVYRASGSSRVFVTQALTNGSGVYTTSALTVADGPFFLVTSNQQSYVEQVYRSSGDRTCTMGTCSILTVGTGISLGGGNVSGIDFALAAGGRVGGTITDASGGAAIGNLSSSEFVTVTLYDAAGILNVGLFVNTSGVYSLSSGLPAGNYFIRTSNSRGYIDQLYSGVACVPATTCNSVNAPTSGTAVAVTVGNQTTANFALNRGGTISGAVTRASDGSAVTTSGMSVQIFNSAGTNVTAAGVGSTTGLYALTTGLPAGTYYARTTGASAATLVDQLYNGIACPGGSCTATSGTPLTLTVGNNTVANFPLQAGVSISGTITSAATSGPLNQISVNAYRANGSSLQFVASTSTASNGTYSLTIADPAQGPFFLTTYNTQGFVEQVYRASGDRTCTMQACAILSLGSGISVTGGSATGINFALAPGGRIGGTITDAVSGAGLTGLNSTETLFVTLMDGAGNGMISSGTNASGAYQFESGLPAGNYYIRTINARGYVDQLYTGVACLGNTCSAANVVATGTPVAVTAGNTATANLALQRGGTISGALTNAVTGAAATGSGVFVQLFDAAGVSITSASVNSTTGLYAITTGLPSGNYFVRTQGASNAGLVDELHNDLPCPNFQCTITTGTPVTVSAPSATTVNFPLTPGGVITGTVRNAATTAVLQGASIQVFTATGSTLGSTTTNASGVYTVRGLPVGTYYVRSTGPTGFIDEIYNNQTCLGCSNANAALVGTAVVVTAGGTNTVDFDVVAGGTVTGTVTSGGSPVAGVTVSVISTSNFTVRTATTNVSGVYTAAGLPTGTYYVRTSNVLGYINQVYNGVQCVNCNAVTTGTPVAVTAGATTSGINFSLAVGASVSGTVTAAAGGAPLADIIVEAYTTTGTYLTGAQTNSSGAYTLTGLPTGSVTVRTFNTLGYLDQLHSGIPCLFCNAASGTPLAVTAGGTTTGINFALASGGRISGRVTNATTGQGAPSVNIAIYTATGAFVGSTATSISGTYSSLGLPTGSYVVYASGFSADLVSEIYDNVVCLGCGGQQAMTGTPVSVTLGSTTTGIDFALAPGAAITGTIRDQAGNPISGATVRFFNAANVSVGSSSSNAQGVYRLRGMPSGTYYARTELSNTLNYINQVWATPSNLICIGCNATQIGAAITVSGLTTVTGIDFALAPGAAVSGTVTGSTGSPASGVTVQAYSSTGILQRSVSTNVLGAYTVSGLQSGTYYLRAVATGAVPQLFSGVNCVGCSVTTGTAVVLTEGATSTGRDFALTAGGSISGTVTDASGAALAGVTVTITTSTGTSVASATTGTSGLYTVTGLPTGNYFARTSNALGFVNEVFDNIICVGCAATGGTAIAVTSGSTSTANFSLVQGGRISGTVTAAGTGALVVGANIEVYNAAGTFLASAFTSDAGTYTTTVGLPAGSYFILVRATDYVARLYNGIPCVSCAPTSGTPVVVSSGAVTSGIDVVMTPAGRVTGRIDSGGAGLEGVVVTVFDKASGVSRGSATSNASGVWTVNGLPAGTYTARTANALGYVDELYLNSTCVTCPVTGGTGFAVTAGQTTANINFTLDAGARISGRVQDASTNNLAGVTVGVFDPQNRLVQSVTTSQLGTYMTSGLAAGRYFVRTTFNSGGFINQLYSSLLCVNCAANTGTPVDVSGTATTANINFALVLGGTVSGTVTGSGGGGLSGITVRIVNVDNVQVASAVTAANGTYTVTGMPAGTYWARTANSAGLVDQLYNGVTCVACSTTGGTSFNVTAGGTLTGIDFALVAGGGISGMVTGAGGLPLSSVNVTITNASGETIQTRTTDVEGRYATNVGLPAGTYYVRTTSAPGYINEAYNNIPCVNCNPLSGTGVVVASGATTTGIDFALATGSRITGTVTSSTGTPIEGVTVHVLTAQGLVATTTSTNAAGTYRTGVLPAGTFYVRTRNVLGYTDQVYNGRECSNCNPTLGTAVTTDGTSDRSAIDFGLVFGGRIEGAVRNTGGTGIGGVIVTIFTAGGVGIASAETDATGAYTTSVGLSTGTYYASTSNDSGYVDRIYNNVVCIGCAVTTGTPISVTAGSPTTGIDFTLPSGGRISGTVLDGTTTQPIPGAFVNVFSSTGVLVTQAPVGESGAWITPSGLAAGTYYARAASRLGYISKVWNNINCASCSPMIGTPITVTADTTSTGINFSLVKGGKVSGVVTDATTGVPLRSVTVQTYDTANNLVTTSFTDAAGRFTSASGLTVGTYYVRTVNGLGYIDEVYNDVQCLSCLTNIGTAIAIGPGADVTGIDFALTPGGRIGGTIIETSTGNPLSGVAVRVFDSAGKLVGSPMTDSAGGYVTTGGLPAGTYYVRTVNSLGYLDEVYNNTVCTACDPRLGTGVVVAGTSTTTGIDFSLAPGGGISGRVTAGESGNPIGNVKVSVYNPAGSVIATLTTDGSGNFSGSGLAAGTYYLRTFNLLGYVDEAFSDVACAPCTVTSSTAVVVTAGTTTTGRNFILARGGLVSGYVTDNVSNAPLVGVTVSFYLPGTLTFVGRTLPTDEAGYYAISLPVGTYVAEVDAVNGYASSGTSASLRSRSSLRTSATSTVGVTLGGETSGVAFQLAACTPPAFSVTSLATGRQGTAYSQVASASGGSGALTWVLVDGTLTPGLTLNGSTGVVSGTPTVAGTANFTLGVADASDCSATQTFAITTDIPLPEVTLTPSTLAFGAVKNGASGNLINTTADQTVTVTFTNGAPNWTATSDQSWLSIASGTGSGNGSFTASIANPGNVIGGSTSLSATITLTAVGVTNAPATIAVTLTVEQTGTVPIPPFGQVDTPVQDAAGVQGAIGMTGWALDNVGVDGVKVYRNCLGFDDPGNCQTILSGTPQEANVVFIGDAAFLAGARPDVAAAFTTYPNNHAAGWGVLILTSMLPHVPAERQYGGQGPLTLYAVARDVEGNQVLLGRSSAPGAPDLRTPTAITMDNATIAKPFGTIDTPPLAATLSGVVANFGWALTPDANVNAGDPDDILIPTNGTTMTVFIDSLPVAQVVYNQCRGTVGNPVPGLSFCNDDVSNIFGNVAPLSALVARSGNVTRFRNLDAGRAPIGAYLLDTTTLSNGLHTIAWSVTDSAGRTEGIGSRFFTVLNGSLDAPTVGDAAVSGVLRAEARASMQKATVQSASLMGRTGFNTNAAWKTMAPEVDGTYRVRLPEVGRLELSFAAPISSAVMMANGVAEDLPVGAAVRDAWFGWMPPAGYFGDYRLVFTTAADTITVIVTVAPAAPVAADASEILMDVDPVEARTGRITVTGTAVDPKAALGSGIGLVHVWGRRLDAQGLRAGEVAPVAAPVFLGEAQLDGRTFRYDGAATAGTWELTVYVWNERTARWEEARTVVAVVR